MTDRWPDPIVDHLRARWVGGAHSVVIARELTDMAVQPRAFTEDSVYVKASRLGLGRRQMDPTDADSVVFAALLARGKTYQQVAAETNHTRRQVLYMVSLLMLYGLTDPVRERRKMYAGSETRFGFRLHNLRVREGISQREFANMVGVTPQHVTRWEGDQSKPRANRLPNIAAALHVSEVDLLGEFSKDIFRNFRT